MDFQDTLANQPVVIDNGSGMLKAGFAGADAPKCVIPTIVGRPKHTRVMAGALEGEHFMGSKLEQNRGLLKLTHPMEHGIVENWNDMERLWQFLYSEELHIHSEDHPVLLTEAPLNPKKNREKSAEVFFESFNVPAMFISLQAVLSLYASGRTTGVVLDSGDGVTHAVPIYEGFALPHSITRVDVAGRDVTQYLQLLLRKQGFAFHTTSEFEIIREIKEKVCYVAADPEKEEKDDQDRNAKPKGTYRLPDGTEIEVGGGRFRAPEVLFRPDLVGLEYVGIHECLSGSILKSDMDLRSTLYANIVLSGGSTLFRGFGDRLLNEVKRQAPKDIKIRISAPQERKFSTWMGGSILASLNTFKKMWVTSSEWKEHGASIIHRKTF
eukprot:comp14895_c0_seq1/m.11443 comp14895_c0_seq1/g.11443  ORF comp14895_c0_seq1/g.11443 comp14895_c0_seq1/m.11443 type:complete len:381 (-) comp14895_c0_seq1:205-1347(-)